MKIKETLILVKHTGILTGLTDLGDTDINILSFEKKEVLSAHALMYFASGVFQI